jgi:class 3 adenylate cyclase
MLVVTSPDPFAPATHECGPFAPRLAALDPRSHLGHDGAAHRAHVLDRETPVVRIVPDAGQGSALTARSASLPDSDLVDYHLVRGWTMVLDVDRLSLTEIIRLQDQLSAALSRRFERSLALSFSDIVGSTPYFTRFGDEAGKRLQQRHLDLLQPVISAFGGWVVDTAGDGAFVCFSQVQAAVDAFTQFQEVLLRDNAYRPREHKLVTRIGIHWGLVLTDGTVVAGEAVNLCARVAQKAEGREILVTRPAFLELALDSRLRCRPLPPLKARGFPDPIELMRLEWRDMSHFPASVRLEESGEEIPLPDKDVITFGRLREVDGVEANDVVLEFPDVHLTRQISRWHFELHRQPEGFCLRVVSGRPTEVDGREVRKEERVPIVCGTAVRLSRAVTLTFLPGKLPPVESDETRSSDAL